MKPTIDLVRRERDGLEPDITRRSRSMVKIRNSTITLAFGLVIWLPIAIVLQNPRQFLTTLVAYLVLSAIIAALTWYVVGYTRYHAMAVLEEIAERHPDETTRLASLLTVPWYVLPFGPWYKAVYLPAFVSRWIGRAARSVIPR